MSWMVPRSFLFQIVLLFSLGYVAYARVDGSWSQWSNLSACTKTCGGGQQQRERFCNNPSPSNGGSYCFDGSSLVYVQYEVYTCGYQNCPVNGNWGMWSSWTSCGITCGSGTQSRNRYCNSPAPAYDGLYCSGYNIDTKSCYANVLCPVNGEWGMWSGWTSCGVTCGSGTKTRKKYCNNPAPANGGLSCLGTNAETQNCTIRLYCPVDGDWTFWSEWSTCSTSCGGGNVTRERNCTNPYPMHGGKICNGSAVEIAVCSVTNCPAILTTGGDSQGVAIGGSIGAVVMVLTVVIVIVVLRKKRNGSAPKRCARSTSSKPLEQAGINVMFRPEPKSQDNLYLNIGRESGLSCTDTDDVLCQKPIDASEYNSTDDNVYCNVVLKDPSEVKLLINVNELRDYIKKRELNEGLINEYKTLPYEAQYPTTIATTKENMPKNRFKFIFPYDHSRIVLQNGPDYINANFIDGFEKEKCYIACQGPTKTTLVDYWRMVWQLYISRIVMLTNLVEGSKRKCERYWPEEEMATTHGNLVITLLNVKTRATYVTRLMSVEDTTTKEKRSIIQYHFTSWPDHGTPDPLYLVLFHRHVLSEQSASLTGPLLVHCSAGIGRTGTYIGLDALYEEGKTTGFIDVVAFVKKMRQNRMNMVQTPEQYVCLHRALYKAFTMKDRKTSKNDFGMVWKDIMSDKRPINHQILREEFKMLEEKKLEHSNKEHVFATSPENKEKNRNPSVLPADTDRVYLSSFEKGRTDYINAVRVPSYTKLIGYITTQLPLPDTKVDFWAMVRDQDSTTIVLFLTDHSEADFVYSTSKSTGSLGLNTLKITNTVDEEHGIKVVSLTLSKKDTKSKDIIIYQVVCDGIPEADILCKLTNLISTRISMTEGPVTVVSSDGASICGLFCTFTNAVSSMTIDENADIFQLARILQLKRPEFFKNFIFVYTPKAHAAQEAGNCTYKALANREEYRKVYEAINYYLESTNVYANF